MLNSASVSTLFNKHSGVVGVSGVSSDMRDIEHAIEEGNERAKLTIKMYAYRIAKYIGSYVAALNGLDLLVFTGGVGEHQMKIREDICEHFSYMGLKIDKPLNADTKKEEILISTPDSKVKVVIIPTDEEFMIASDTMEIVK